MDALKDYVMGRMLWDVTLNPDALISEFLDGYFGTEAAPFVRLSVSVFCSVVRVIILFGCPCQYFVCPDPNRGS
jgi:hypothetical protein